MRLYIILLMLVMSLSSGAVAPLANADVQGTVEPCGDAFCLTFVATSNAGAGSPSYIELTIPVSTALFIASPNVPCHVVPSDSTARVFVGCELIAWQGHSVSATIRLIPVVHNGAVWITPSAYIVDPLMIAPLLIPVPFFIYVPLIRR